MIWAHRSLGAARLWIAGYSNEVDGYLPDATIVAEGGYEARGLVADIGFYSADAEPTLVNAVRALQADMRSPFALWDEGVPFPARESPAYPDGATDVMVRRENANSLVFFSHDHGRTWSEPCEHNFPMASSKIYAGLLSTGERYLLCNLPTSRRRDLLVIAVRRPGEKAFVKMWKVRDGYAPDLKAGPEWSYPCAVEPDGRLYVVYTSEKHHCAMTVIPVESLVTQASPSGNGTSRR